MRPVIDVSLTLAFAGRPAVGIVRVEREIARAFLLSNWDVKFVRFDAPSGAFRSITGSRVAQSIGGTYPAAGSPVDGDGLETKYLFQTDDTFLSCGLTWDTDFFSDVYRAKQARGFRVIQIIYDVIPTLIPELCVPGMRVRFQRFLIDVAQTADVVYGISDWTNRDLAIYYKKLGLTSPLMRRIRLGQDIENSNRGKSSEISGDIADIFQSGRFVLYVSSIEPRKNHLTLYRLWSRLFDDLGDECPVLVLVGKIYWNVDDLVYYIRNCDAYLAGKIKILSDISDSQMSSLMERCHFTVYPSLYEGWGLPIGESIAYGKAFIASNTSSMVEASQGLGILLDPLDAHAWYEAILRLTQDQEYLAGVEKEICSKRQIRTWQSAASLFMKDLEEVAGNR